MAHNTLVVDEKSHFAGDWKTGENHGTRQLAASLEGPTRYTVAEIDSAYKDVTIRRALLLIEVERLANPLTLDNLRGTRSGSHVSDLLQPFCGPISIAYHDLNGSRPNTPCLAKEQG